MRIGGRPAGLFLREAKSFLPASRTASSVDFKGAECRFSTRPSSSSSILPSIFSQGLLCRYHKRFYATTPPETIQLSVSFQRGLPYIVIPLPSRPESCQFTLRPISDTVGTFCAQLRREDRGIDHASIYSPDGTRISSSTSIEHLLQFGAFRLRVNDKIFDVAVREGNVEEPTDRVRELNDLKAIVARLHGVLNVDEYKLERERKLQERLEKAEQELQPLLDTKQQIERECEQHSERVLVGFFGAMGLQTGIFARLTWWDFSWDIMEPVTYFATFSTVIASFGYYLYTKQPFEYTLARYRIFTRQFYKRAAKHSFDIDKYNRLVDEVDELRRLLSCIRDPLHLHLPVSYLSKFEK
ncbi:unnamed protein product, partial [Mesorhabditis spiculigera]